ncbi:unnamed protein product, partial [Didymodactylos carnosus]
MPSVIIRNLAKNYGERLNIPLAFDDLLKLTNILKQDDKDESIRAQLTFLMHLIKADLDVQYVMDLIEKVPHLVVCTTFTQQMIDWYTIIEKTLKHPE